MKPLSIIRRLVIGALLAGTLDSVVAQQPAVSTAAESQAQPDDQTSTESLGSIPVRSVSTPENEPAPQQAALPEPDEVIVTATKRAVPVRKIAGTVNVLTGEELEQQGVQSIDQIVQLVPGVNLTDDGTGGTAKRITIRGVSTGLGVNPTAGTLFGDIPFSDPFIPKVQLDPNPFDMATVEVLKGPQGTLFGGTGLNGLIRYVPEAPQLDEFRVKYFSQFNSYPGNGGTGWSYGGVVNAPFADNTAAVRLMAFNRDSPGYTDDTLNHKRDVNTLEQYGLRGAVTWLPADRWKVSLLGVTQQTREDDLAYTDNYDGRLQHGNSPRPSPAEYHYNIGSLTVEREFDWATLTAQSSYFAKRFDIFLEASRATGGKVPTLAGADANHSEGITEELRLVSSPGDSPWSWLAGAFYYDLDLYDCANIGAAEGLPTVPGMPNLPIVNGLVTTPCPRNASKLAGEVGIGTLLGDVNLKEKALFGELTRQLGEYWDATLGARGYRIQTGGEVTTAGVLYASANQGQAVDRNAATAQNGLSPKASIVFHPTEDVRSYFTVSRGFRFGGPQIAASTPTTTVPETYKSDSLWNYELGLRTDWFDGSLRADASVYYLDWKNPQIYQVSADGLTNYIDNVGAATGRGMEMALRYLPTFLHGLSLNTSIAWNKTVTAEVFDSQQAGPIPVGSPWPLSPHWQTSTTLAYTMPVRSWDLGASLRHTYLSHACNKIECTGEVFGYNTFDVNVFASAAHDSWWPSVSLSMNNVTDKRGIGNITTNPEPAGDTVTYIAPRALVVRLSGSF